MAVIDTKGRLHGKVANIVYRTVGNTNIVQSRPAMVKQTAATKSSAMEFGLASNCARIIRSAFLQLAYTADNRMINRLNTAVLKCIKNSRNKERGERDLHDADLTHLHEFQFNMRTPLSGALLVKPYAELGPDNRIKVSIPAIRKSGDLKSPPHSHDCKLRLMLLVINFRENYFEHIAYTEFPVSDGIAFPTREWHPEEVLPAGSIALLSASLHYYGGKGMLEQPMELNSTAFSPAELLAAYHIPETSATSPLPAQETGQNKETTGQRHPLSNYRGKEILRQITGQTNKTKQKAGTKDGDARQKTGERAVGFIEGKVFYQKE